MTRTLWQSWVFVGLAALGCSASPASPGTGINGSGATGSGATGGTIPTGTGGTSPTGSGGTIPTGSGGTIPTAGTSGVDPSDTRNVPVRQRVCEMGVCTCLRLALLGTLDSAANQKDTRPFIDWLNGNSGGTAVVTMVSTKPIIDATFLADYDILVIANVNGWTFAASETAAVESWVREKGGGIIALTGFVSTDAEPPATSQLLEFAGFRYQAPKTAENGQQEPVYYKGGTTNLKECLSWTGTSEAIITTPIKFTPQTGPLEKLTFSLDYVGAYIGWSVAAPPAATTVASDPISGQPIASALELDGTGRIFVFGDEWVIFANQWEPVGTPYNMNQDASNMCWNAANGTFHSVQTLYQTKQFWYDAINWVAPPNECGFQVEDPDVVVK